MSEYTIYHNPRCSKSRQTLALLEQQGIEPEVILYLKNTPDAQSLAGLISKLNISARDLLRKGEDDYKQNDLANPKLSDTDIIALMVKYPKLIERPIVVKGQRAVLGRPPENVEQLFT